jgi:hypothetical protein
MIKLHLHVFLASYHILKTHSWVRHTLNRLNTIHELTVSPVPNQRVTNSGTIKETYTAKLASSPQTYPQFIIAQLTHQYPFMISLTFPKSTGFTFLMLNNIKPVTQKTPHVAMIYPLDLPILPPHILNKPYKITPAPWIDKRYAIYHSILEPGATRSRPGCSL